MTIGIIGLGLIGGSMAIDLRRRGFAEKVVGVEAESVNASAALAIGLVDEVVDLEECLYNLKTSLTIIAEIYVIYLFMVKNPIQQLGGYA